MFGTALHYWPSTEQIIAEAESGLCCVVTAGCTLLPALYSLRSHLPSFTTSVRGETLAGLVGREGEYQQGISPNITKKGFKF